MIKKLFFILFLSLITFLSFNWRHIALNAGILSDDIYISGTGSMYPTFPKGTGENIVELARETVAWPQMRQFPGGFALFGKMYFGYQLKLGDIISFSNAKTTEITKKETGKEAGFVKRVIALPGEVIEIRDGFVFLNGEELIEPYTAQARSTFGGSFLTDCRKLIIPNNFVFVMGDNRKGSSDSRHELELVAIEDIDHVIPYQKQQEFQSKWRDATKDYLEANKPLLNTAEYLKLLNEKRQANGLKPLKYQSKLEASAKKRTDTIIKYNDYSYEATKSGLTMEKAMRDVGYSNIVWGEAPTLGYYDAGELLENFFQFPDTKKFLLEKDFQETGLAVKVGEINNCPVQVIVQHFAGYVPPDYSKEVIDSWEKALESAKTVYPSWQKIKEFPDLYHKNQADYDEILSLFQQKIDRLTAIVSRMKANLWLTGEEKKWVEEDPGLSKRLQTLTQKLSRL